MEDLKRRILQIVSNCNKPKVKSINKQINKRIKSTTFFQFFALRLQQWLHSLCVVVVPHPPAGALVRAVWRRAGWLPHRDGTQEGGGTQPAAAGGGVAHHSPLIDLSKPGVRRLTCAHHRRLSSLPSRTHSAYHWGWSVTQVCSQTPYFIFLMSECAASIRSLKNNSQALFSHSVKVKLEDLYFFWIWAPPFYLLRSFL